MRFKYMEKSKNRDGLPFVSVYLRDNSVFFKTKKGGEKK
jgi:hypothetical protein